MKFMFTDHFKREHTVYTFGNNKGRWAAKFHNITPDNELLANYEKYTSLIQSIEYLKEYGGILVFLNSDLNMMDHVKEYGIGAQILKYFGIKQIELLSNNHAKYFRGIHGFYLEIVLQIKL